MRALQATMKSWALLACGLACGAAADPPARVGRLSHVQGEVSLQSGGEQILDRALRNWPLTSGDRIVAAADARAEISFGTVTVRLDSGTDLAIVELNRAPLHLGLEAGSLNLTVRDLRGAETVAVKTRGGTLHLLRAGEYDVTVSDDGAVVAGVRRGEARVQTSVSAFQQLAGERARVAVDGTVTLGAARRAGEFDRWSQRRERKFSGSRTAPHVARGLVGYEDLDAHGDWRWEPRYGMVWQPGKLPKGWAPYRQGEWILKQPWGWTWIDASPWGFAPFHYGRWVQVRERWCWLPGARALPPVYAPALVKWMTHPTDSRLIGWRPLQPYEDFASPYQASRRHVDAVNTFARPGNGAAALEKQTDSVTWIARSILEERVRLQRLATVAEHR